MLLHGQLSLHPVPYAGPSNAVTYRQSNAVTYAQSHGTANPQSDAVTYPQSNCRTDGSAHCCSDGSAHCCSDGRTDGSTNTSAHCCPDAVTYAQSHASADTLRGLRECGRCGFVRCSVVHEGPKSTGMPNGPRLHRIDWEYRSGDGIDRHATRLLPHQ